MHAASETERAAEAARSELRVGDVARELLADAVRPLVLPVMEDERLVGRAVLEVELAAGEALRARERAAREERRNERCRVADTGGVARRVRVVGAAGHGPAQVAAELAMDAGVHQMTVLAGRVARARALACKRHEGALVRARDAERP